MKKLLVGSAAIALGLAVAVPANAQVELGLGGHFKGYVSWVDQDEVGTADVRDFDIVRETEVHFTGETTLDNGLTVGAHIEAEADGNEGFEVDESYVYFSGAWGRVNFGAEDGAAYLLQVAAPSADSNVDGIRQYVSPINYAAMGLAGFTLDYANDGPNGTGDNSSDKITYLTPVFSGFQAGVSYSPEYENSDAFSNDLDDEVDDFGDVWEIAARYEGAFNNVGFNIGAGYTHGGIEEEGAFTDDFQEWNVGLDLDIGAFGLGAVYTENNGTQDDGSDNDTWVLGADYTTGPFKIGASYLNQENEQVGGDFESDRYSAGVVYTYGPGMTFRGSVGFVDHDLGAADADATYALVGTQINF